MSWTRPAGVFSGLAWMSGIAAFGSVGLGLTGGLDTPHRTTTAAAAPAVLRGLPGRPGLLRVPAAATEPSGARDQQADGWFHEPMTFTWTAREDDSGIVSCYDEFVRKVNASWNQALHIPCVEGAASAEPHPALFRRYDGTAPTLDPVAVPGVVVRGGVVTLRPRGADALSGIDSQGCNGGRAPTTRDLGPHSVGCFARDRAGNKATASASYLVVARLPRRS